MNNPFFNNNMAPPFGKSDISNQLIRDSYQYVVQSDTVTGVMYRINGDFLVNPIFASGLTIYTGFTFIDGNQQLGYVLTSDGNGNAAWAPASAATPSSGVTSITVGEGLSANSTTGAVKIVFTGTSSSSGEYLPLSGGTVTGDTIFKSGLTANILTITGLTSATDSNVVTIDGSGVLHTYPLSGLTGNTSVSGEYLPLSGGTVTGDTIFQSGLTANTLNVTGNTLLSGLTATTISATTYDNLPNTLYTGDGILLSDRIVNLSSYTLNFSSSTNPNTLVLSGGNIGIGTNPTSERLNVSGNTKFTLGTNGYIKLEDTVGGYPTHLQASYGGGFLSNNSIFDGSVWRYSNSGAASMLQMEPTLGQFIFYTANAGSSGNNVPFVETIRLVSGNTGINVSLPTNKLHVLNSTDPVRFEGVQTSSDTELLTIDGSGVVHKILTSSVGGVFLRNETNSGATDTITINQSIFNPSDLTVLSTSVFIVDTNADYYVLGDFYNSGTTIVNGTLKIGGVLYNYGTITGSGIIE